MKYLYTKKYRDMDFTWISSHYDVHLRGLCKSDGKLCWFDTDKGVLDVDEGTCAIFKLSWYEKILYRFKQKMFELCVGKHWTYPCRKDGTIFYYKKPVILHKILMAIYYWNWKCLK